MVDTYSQVWHYFRLRDTSRGGRESESAQVELVWAITGFDNKFIKDKRAAFWLLFDFIYENKGLDYVVAQHHLYQSFAKDGCPEAEFLFLAADAFHKDKKISGPAISSLTKFLGNRDSFIYPEAVKVLSSVPLSGEQKLLLFSLSETNPDINRLLKNPESSGKASVTPAAAAQPREEKSIFNRMFSRPKSEPTEKIPDDKSIFEKIFARYPDVVLDKHILDLIKMMGPIYPVNEKNEGRSGEGHPQIELLRAHTNALRRNTETSLETARFIMYSDPADLPAYRGDDLCGYRKEIMQMLGGDDKEERITAEVNVASSFLRNEPDNDQFFTDKEAFKILMEYMCKNKCGMTGNSFGVLYEAYKRSGDIFKGKVLKECLRMLEEDNDTNNTSDEEKERLRNMAAKNVDNMFQKSPPMTESMFYAALLMQASSCLGGGSEEETKIATVGLARWYGNVVEKMPADKRKEIRGAIESVFERLAPLSNDAKRELYQVSETVPVIQPAVDKLLQNNFNAGNARAN